MSSDPHSIPPAITDVAQLKDHPALARLLGWRAESVMAAKFDRDELTITVDRSLIREACTILKPEFNFLSDVTSVDWLPAEPRFQVTYHLLSHKLKERVRLRVMLPGDDAIVESIISVWPAANFSRISSTVIRVPRMTGLPSITFGFETISSESCTRILLEPV